MIKFSSASCGRILVQKMMMPSKTYNPCHLQAFRMHNDAAMSSNANSTTKLCFSLPAKLSALCKAGSDRVKSMDSRRAANSQNPICVMVLKRTFWRCKFLRNIDVQFSSFACQY
jgi:hypothetical protein